MFERVHDYGMGGAWWWVHATSAREVLETFAEVEVIDSPQAVDQAQGWDLAEVDIDSPAMPGGLDDLRAKRDAQRLRWNGHAGGRPVALRIAWSSRFLVCCSACCRGGGSAGCGAVAYAERSPAPHWSVVRMSTAGAGGAGHNCR